MAMKSRAASAFVMFDVVYADGTRSSNRKVAASALGAQDREIAAASGRPRSHVKSITRSPVKVAIEEAGNDRKAKGGKR